MNRPYAKRGDALFLLRLDDRNLLRAFTSLNGNCRPPTKFVTDCSKALPKLIEPYNTGATDGPILLHQSEDGCVEATIATGAAFTTIARMRYYRFHWRGRGGVIIAKEGLRLENKHYRVNC